MAYDWRTTSPGVQARHADRCPVRNGEPCTCGPLGYRGSFTDRRTGDREQGPLLETEEAARRWRGEQRTSLAASSRIAEEGTTVGAVVDDFIEAAEEGRARDSYGRPYQPNDLRDLQWALEGHVGQAIGHMELRDVRRRQLQDLLDRLDGAGTPQARVQQVAEALAALYAYAYERRLVDSDPVAALTLAGAGDHAPPMRRRRMVPAASGTAPVELEGMIPDHVIWMLLKVVALIFILIALVLVAESV
jgi:hypothetical protein